MKIKFEENDVIYFIDNSKVVEIKLTKENLEKCNGKGKISPVYYNHYNFPEWDVYLNLDKPYTKNNLYLSTGRTRYDNLGGEKFEYVHKNAIQFFLSKEDLDNFLNKTTTGNKVKQLMGLYSEKEKLDILLDELEQKIYYLELELEDTVKK